MKTIQKSLLKEDYYYEEKPWYDTLPETLSVPNYQTEIFTETMSHKEILDTYNIESYKNIQDAFAVAADCIKTLKNDYNGRIVYFMDGDTRCRLGVCRDSDGRLEVGIRRVSPGGRWSAGSGVLYSAETLIPLKSDTLALKPFDPSENQLDDVINKAIETLKSRGFTITKEF